MEKRRRKESIHPPSHAQPMAEDSTTDIYDVFTIIVYIVDCSSQKNSKKLNPFYLLNKRQTDKPKRTFSSISRQKQTRIGKKGERLRIECF
jgi:hypothetical protein